MKPDLPARHLTRHSGGVKNGQPDGCLLAAGPIHAMPAMGRDVEVIASLEMNNAILKTELGFALQNNHPFALLLVIPEIIRAALASGDDALDAQAGALQQILKLLAFFG